VLELYTVGLSDDLFDKNTITDLGKALNESNEGVINSIIDVFAAAIPQKGFRDKIFDGDIIDTLQRIAINAPVVGSGSVVLALPPSEDGITSSNSSSSKFLNAAVAQADFRDKFFNAEVIVALRCALTDVKHHLRSSVVGFFTGVIDQERFRD